MTAIKLASLIIILHLAGLRCDGAFPLAEFKRFLNERPTIESFEFQVRSKNYRMEGLPADTYRSFSAVIGDERAYRLTEDQSTYKLTLDDPKNPVKQLVYSPLPFSAYGRFEELFWTTFHSNRVNGIITTVVNDSDVFPVYGPARLSRESLSVAYRALNYGIPDLRNMGLTWEGLRFSCPSNEAGSAIDGFLHLKPDGTPNYAAYNLTRDGIKYSYRATYLFEKTAEVPDFFPSRIKVESIKGTSSQTTADFIIKRLTLSTRKLSPQDVAFQPDTTPYPIYVYTNHQVFAVGSNSLIKLKAGSFDSPNPGWDNTCQN